MTPEGLIPGGGLRALRELIALSKGAELPACVSRGRDPTGPVGVEGPLIAEVTVRNVGIRAFRNGHAWFYQDSNVMWIDFI